MLGAAALAAAGALGLCSAELAAQREAFDTSARIAHRLLSQRAVEHEAILGTLALLQPEADDGGAAVQRLIALYPQLLRVHRRAGDGRWPQPAWDAAEAQSRAAGQRAVLASFDAQGGRFVILRAADPASFALEVDLQRAVPWADWPYDEAARSGPVRAVLGPDGGPAWRLHGDDAASAGPWPMAFSKHLAADSQPFDLRVAQSVGWSALPWGTDGRLGRRGGGAGGAGRRGAAPARRAPARRAAAPARPGDAPGHAGRDRCRPGARAEPAAGRADGQHAGRAATAGRRHAGPGPPRARPWRTPPRRRAAPPTWCSGCAARSSPAPRQTPGPRCSPCAWTTRCATRSTCCGPS
jgi:hypothetical protein